MIDEQFALGTSKHDMALLGSEEREDEIGVGLLDWMVIQRAIR
jgi:hypothetical protein